MMTMLVEWWRRRRWTAPRLARVVYCGSHADLPSTLPPRRLYLVGMPGQLKWAAFSCPCGRRHQIQLNLDRSRRPVWTLELTPDASLRPSVDALEIDRCHFWVRDGRARWVRDATLAFGASVAEA